MKLLERLGNDPHTYLVNCPGCGMLHQLFTSNTFPDSIKTRPCWTFNGNFDKPTFSPSLVVRYPQDGKTQVCHSFIKDGQWQFLNDCTHGLAGKTVPMIDIDEE